MSKIARGSTIAEILAEYLHWRSDDVLETSILETALFIESEFGLQLTDEELDAKHLGSAEAISRTIVEKLGRS